MGKFKIPSIPTNKCIRFPNDIKGENCTFTAFAIEAVRVALETLKENQ